VVPKPKISWQQNYSHLRFTTLSSIIEDLIARKIFNNRGEETIEVDVITNGGFGRASVLPLEKAAEKLKLFITRKAESKQPSKKWMI
jgi:enolase